MIQATATIRPRVTCEARCGERYTDWGFKPAWCARAIALGSLRDRQGVVRRFCQARGHREQVVERYGEAEPYLVEDGLTAAKARADLLDGVAHFDEPAIWQGCEVEVV